MEQRKKGYFVISLDFELFWGVLDKFTLEEYKENIENVPRVIEELLLIFKKYEIHATWGVVGSIFFEKKDFLERKILKPIGYRNSKLSAYNYLELIKNSESTLFFGKLLIEKIKKTKYQEIATHTLSHYFVCEEGQKEEDFEYDIKIVKSIHEVNNLKVNSIIFPKNQLNSNYNNILKKYGIKYYRGNEESLFYRKGKIDKESVFIRIGRFLDSYINIGGNYTYDIKDIRGEKGLLNIKASRFLRPYNSKLSYFEFIKLNRIKKQMKNAAVKKEIFHLWWHPHNFGKNFEKNISMLIKILEYYNFLKEKYNFESKNIMEVGKEYENFNFRT